MVTTSKVTSTPQEPDFSHRFVKMTAGSGIALQLIRPVIALATFPILLSYLGQAGLGVWMIALSFVGLLTLLNTGLTITLVTAIGRASAEGNAMKMSQYSCAAMLLATITALLMAAIFTPVVLLLEWGTILNLEGSPAEEDVRKMLLLLVLVTALGMLASVPRQIMLGRLHGFISNSADIVGWLLSAGALIVAISYQSPLWLLATAFLLPPTIVVILVGSFYILKTGITPFAPGAFCKKTLRELARDSVRMVGYQASFAISSQSDVWLIGIVLGPASSAVYGIAQRLFSVPIMMSFMINQAQWPFLSQLDSKGKPVELARYVRKALFMLTVASGAAAALIVVLYDPIIDLWLGTGVKTDPLLLFGMLAWVVVAASVNTLDSLLKARNQTSFLMRAMMVMAIANIAITLALMPVIGPAGAVWGSAIAYFFCLLVPYLIHLKPVLLPSDERHASHSAI